MYQIIIFSKQSQATMLWFRAAEKAESVFQNIQMVLAGNLTTNGDAVTQKDEFGCIFTAHKDNVSHVIINDMGKQAELYKLMEGLGYAQRTK